MVEPIGRTPEIQEVTPHRPLKPTRVGWPYDAVHISYEAQSALARHREIQLARKAIEEAPSIREEKVELARRRLDSGFYHQSGTVAMVADKIMEEMGL